MRRILITSISYKEVGGFPVKLSLISDKIVREVDGDDGYECDVVVDGIKCRTETGDDIEFGFAPHIDDVFKRIFLNHDGVTSSSISEISIAKEKAAAYKHSADSSYAKVSNLERKIDRLSSEIAARNEIDESMVNACFLRKAGWVFRGIRGEYVWRRETNTMFLREVITGLINKLRKGEDDESSMF